MYAPAMTGGFRDFYRPDPAIGRAPPAEGIKGNGDDLPGSPQPSRLGWKRRARRASIPRSPP